ncbi:hypothetical protein BO94DRAFT_470580, partial [Aspergillus sclerotioniger CBS 115572]
YELRRTAINSDDGHVGRAEMPRYVALDIIDKAPAPSHNKTTGRRPHAHFDAENLFPTERAGLEPLEEVASGDGQRPVFWAYPTTYFDYANQNRRGCVPGPCGPQSNPVPHRIITDKDKNVVGMVTHPLKKQGKFVRVTERTDKVLRQKLGG